MKSDAKIDSRFTTEKLKAIASVAWRDVVTPEESARESAYLGGDGTLTTSKKVHDQFGIKAAAAWEKAKQARAEFFAAVAEYVRSIDSLDDEDATSRFVRVKPLEWADEQPGTQGMVRSQEDGQVELYTICGRYIIRYRESVEGARWVPRYMGHLPLAVRNTLEEAKRDAQEDHERRIRAEVLT